MLLNLSELLLLMGGFFVIATLYSSVGFGGGSSYLALLALVFVSFFAIRSMALICNLVVVFGSSYLYWKKGYLDIKQFLPFVMTSIPMAFLGARFRLEENTFFIILGVSLIIAALALLFQTMRVKNLEEISSSYPPWVSYVLGGGIGLLSGLVGIGGGIFLAPVLLHMKWDKSIKIAALASFFILVNSISSIVGLMTTGTFELPWLEASGLVLAVFIGGQIGVRLSLNTLTGNSIKVITAVLVLMVGIRVLLVNGLAFTF